MKTNTYNWVFGDNGEQTYYECKIGVNYLCVFANKKGENQNLYMGFYSKDSGHRNIYNKVYNDRQRKKGNCTSNGIPTSVRLLGSKDIDYMKRKVIYCYEHNTQEVTP